MSLVPENSPDENTSAWASSEERRRLGVLHRYGVLDTPPEPELDDLTAMAAQICETPIAMISLVDEERQWFKSKVGVETVQTPRSQSFCAHALNQRNLFVVPDALHDSRFAQNPSVTGEPGIRFYAGAPLATPYNAILGTLCIIDRVPRKLSLTQECVLESLSRRVMVHLETRRRMRLPGFSEDGHLLPGVYDLTLDQLRLIVCTNPYRSALWSRLMSFLSWPILNQHFSYAYIGGGFVSNDPHPRDIDVILQTREPYGPASFAVLSRFFLTGLDRILQMYSVHLHFWMEHSPAGLSDYLSFFQYAPPAHRTYAPNCQKRGIVRIDLQDPEIISKFQEAITST